MSLSRPGPSPALPDELRGELPALRDLAVDLAEKAAALVEGGRAAAISDVETKTSRTDVVTAMDRASEDYLRRRLAAERPGDGVFGEEAGAGAGHRAGAAALTWVVDPIDGTVNYLYGRPEYTVSVAAVLGDPQADNGWWPVVGAVANPRTREVYHAYDGGGAFLRGPDGQRPVRASAVTDPGLVLLATGFGYEAHIRAEQARALVEILPAVRDIRRGGSAAWDLCTVASGVVDGYAERGVHVWDVAAGWLIAAEAGATVLTWDGGPDRPPGVLAAPPAVAGPLAHLLEGSYRRAVGGAPA